MFHPFGHYVTVIQRAQRALSAISRWLYQVTYYSPYSIVINSPDLEPTRLGTLKHIDDKAFCNLLFSTTPSTTTFAWLLLSFFLHSQILSVWFEEYLCLQYLLHCSTSIEFSQE